MRLALYLLATVSLLAGCGGSSSNGGIDTTNTAYRIDPQQTDESPSYGDTVTAIASVPVDDITFAVKGGDDFGTLSYTEHGGSDATGAEPPLGFDATTGTARVTYFTPNRLGATCRVVASFIKDGKVVATRTATFSTKSGIGHGV